MVRRGRLGGARHGSVIASCTIGTMATVDLTLSEASQVLSPVMTEQQLRAIVTALGWQPDSHRYTGRAGRPTAAYDATRLMRLHAAVAPFIGIDVV